MKILLLSMRNGSSLGRWLNRESSWQFHPRTWPPLSRHMQGRVLWTSEQTRKPGSKYYHSRIIGLENAERDISTRSAATPTESYRPFQLVIGFGRCGDVHLTSLGHLGAPVPLAIGLSEYLRSVFSQGLLKLFVSVCFSFSARCYRRQTTGDIFS